MSEDVGAAGRSAVDAPRPASGAGVADQPSEWDAATYDRISTPHRRWGESVVGRLALRGDETVIDAGCGSGRVTEQLLARLGPAGRVIAIDASERMLEELAARVADRRLTVLLADLRKPLAVEPADAILSTATFHWVTDHAALFRNLAAALRPGGQLVAQFGGHGNIAGVLAVADAIRPGVPASWLFATAEDTAQRLLAAGFEDVTAWLEPDPVPFEPGEPLETFLRTIILRPYLADMPVGEQDAFVRAVAAGLAEPVVDYVRCNVVARRR